MIHIPTLLISAAVAVLTSTITAYVTTRLKMREDRAKWERDLAFKYAQANVQSDGFNEEIAKQFAAGLLIIEFPPGDRRKLFIPQGGSIIIGRKTLTELGMAGDSGMSRSHAMFKSEGSLVYLQHLGARSLTSLNDEVVLQDKVKLKSGDVVQCSRTKITFQKI